MATRARHKNETKTFAKLTFIEQARSISAQTIILERAIRANLRKAKEEKRDVKQIQTSRARQVERLRGRVTAFKI